MVFSLISDTDEVCVMFSAVTLSFSPGLVLGNDNIGGTGIFSAWKKLLSLRIVTGLVLISSAISILVLVLVPC